jgi:dimethylargininase
VWIQPPATLDGGDVFVIGKRMYVGRSARTNEAGIEQLRSEFTPVGLFQSSRRDASD